MIEYFCSNLKEKTMSLTFESLISNICFSIFDIFIILKRVINHEMGVFVLKICICSLITKCTNKTELKIRAALLDC